MEVEVVRADEGGLPGAPEENSRYTVHVPVTSVMFAGMVRHEARPTVFATGCEAPTGGFPLPLIM